MLLSERLSTMVAASRNKQINNDSSDILQLVKLISDILDI